MNLQHNWICEPSQKDSVIFKCLTFNKYMVGSQMFDI